MLESIMKYLPEALVVARAPDLKGLAVSRRVAELVGVPGEQLKEMRFVEQTDLWQIFHADCKTPAAPGESPLSRSVKTGEVIMGEEWAIRLRRGEIMPVLVSSGPVRNAAGRITGGVVAFSDMTQLKHAWEALEQEYEKEHHTAQTLQKALLPSSLYLSAGYEVAEKYVPAHAGQEVGGDFYDVFRTGSDSAGILIGDVSGKGIESAALAAAARHILHAFAFETSEPAAAVTRANRVLCTDQLDAGAFVTIFLAILNAKTGELSYVNAGHPPAAIRRLDGSVEWLDYGHPALGVIDDYSYGSGSAVLRPGEKIIAYTDGLSEARRDQEFFGPDGIERALRGCGAANSADTVEAIFAAAHDWAHRRISDDAAIVVVERKQSYL